MTEVLGNTGRSTKWVPTDDTFGARLALIRQRMKWGNVKEAAVACGLPPESWRTWERDGVAPRRVVEIAGLIAERTGCDYVWLLTGRSDGQVNHPRVPSKGYPLATAQMARGQYSRPVTAARRMMSHPRDGRPTGHPSQSVRTAA